MHQECTTFNVVIPFVFNHSKYKIIDRKWFFTFLDAQIDRLASSMRGRLAIKIYDTSLRQILGVFVGLY